MKISNILSIASVAIITVSCASIPGKGDAGKIAHVSEMRDTTLEELQKNYPESVAELKEGVGYIVMSNKVMKVPVFGVGSGYGMALERETSETTYLKMRRADIGAGWGARAYKVVVIFQDQKIFDDVIDERWAMNIGAETAAKVGEAGGSVGANAGDVANQETKGYTHYIMTDNGVSATFTSAVVRVSPVKLKHP